MATRFGGGEFAVILPATDTVTARTIAEDLRAAIVAACSEEKGTASAGVATFPDHAGTAEELYRAAHAAMVTVKRLQQARRASRRCSNSARCRA